MVRHLEHDYVQETKPTGFIPHFHETIDSLGGSLGIAIICLAVIAFYFIVTYTITSARTKREAKANKRR